jgi:hypothetical protein
MVSSVGNNGKRQHLGIFTLTNALPSKVNEKKMAKRHVIAIKENLRLCMISPFLVFTRLGVFLMVD